MMNRRRKVAVTMTVAASLTLSGCATNGLADLPLPAPGLSRGGYQVKAVFNDALNLPALAKVRLGGADVGQLESLVARNYQAVATLQIMQGVRLPKGTTAQLRSATPLGDVFIAVKPPTNVPPGTPMLKAGDTIPIEQTSDGATVESLLTGAALLVNGGAVQNLTDLINGAGKATGDQGHALGELIDDTNRLLLKLNGRSEQITASINQLSTLANRLDAKNHVISDVLTNAAPATQVLAENTSQIADLVETAGNTTTVLSKFPSIAGTDTSGRSVIADMNTLSRSFNDVVLHPDARLAPLNRILPPLIKITSSNALSVRGSIDRLILGSIPDIGFPGDPGLHGPKWYDYNQLIGSFQYTLYRLQERIVGRGPNVPQVPVIPGPDVQQPLTEQPAGIPVPDFNQWEVLGPPPGPTLPGQFVNPPGPPPGPAPVPASQTEPKP